MANERGVYKLADAEENITASEVWIYSFCGKNRSGASDTPTPLF